MWWIAAFAWAAEPALTEVLPAEPVPVEAPPTPPEVHSVLLWQGFEHFWERTVFGAWRVPHRVSRFENRVAPGTHAISPDGVATDTTFTFAQSTGVDGDHMNPAGFVARVSGPDLIVRTGTEKVSAIDRVEGSHPRAMYAFHRMLVVDLPPSDTPRTAVAVLQGLSFSSRCVEAVEGCNSNGIWPYKFHVDLAPCEDLGDKLVCPLTIEVGRAWTPGHGGLKGIEEKPLNTRMSLDVEVSWAIVGGPSDEVLAHRIPFENALPTNREIHFAEQIAPVRGLPTGFPSATVALTGLGFDFYPTGRREGLRQRGRYIGGWNLQVRNAGYQPDAGSLDVGHAGGIWLPKTVSGTGVSIEVGMVALQFADPEVEVVEAVRVEGALCSDSHDAPPFSAWEHCDEILGAERIEQTVPLSIPPGATRSPSD